MTLQKCCGTDHSYDGESRGRYHHHCDYSPFKTNEPKYVEGYDPNRNRDETDLFQMEKTRIERIKGR